MEIRIDGSRSTQDNWLRASLAPLTELPRLTPEEEQAAKALGVEPEPYARERYAQELTDVELRDRAVRLVDLVQAWFDTNNVLATVESVWLKTFEAKYRIQICEAGKSNLIFVDESLVDEMFERGSSHAKRAFDHIVEMTVRPREAARAS